MARIETDRDINPTQLGIELGRVPLRVKHGHWVDAPTLDEATLRAKVDAHRADPGYVDPEYVPPTNPLAEFDAAIDAVDTTTVVDAATKQAIDALKAALKGTAGRAGRASARRA